MKKDGVFDIWEMTLSFQKGEEKGFTFFFNSLRPALVYYAHKIVNDRPVAEDVTDESFIKLWERHETFAHPQVIKSWMYTTVRNTCINRLQERKRKIKWEAEYVKDAAVTEADPNFNLVIEAEVIRVIKKGFEKLPTECRKVFHSLYIEGNTVRETAEASNLSISTIKNQKKRGLTILRKYGVHQSLMQFQYQ